MKPETKELISIIVIMVGLAGIFNIMSGCAQAIGRQDSMNKATKEATEYIKAHTELVNAKAKLSLIELRKIEHGDKNP